MASPNYTHRLYYNPYSICSVMALYTFACRGAIKEGENEMVLQEEPIDIQHQEHLSEYFFCDINPRAEVPVLVPAGGKPIPDSKDISLYYAKRYPSLLPGEHAAEIERLVREMHGISFYSLTFTGRPQSQLKNKQVLEELLEKNISDEYRAKIEAKLPLIDARVSYLSDEQVEMNIQRTKNVLATCEGLVKGSRTQWCFGLSQPSMLDTHLVVFLCRLQDVKRDNLIPQALQEYAAKAMDTAEWKGVMRGERTMPREFMASFGGGR